MSEMFKSSSMY
uniref:Uncharacterized protein n=1 Tax=Arundo donax TaxID=35708 RepID=A0A0A9EQU8_ARUDO